MLISVIELKELHPDKFINLSDKLLERKLAVIENKIRNYTNNNFINRNSRAVAEIINGKLKIENTTLYEVEDTVEISDTLLNNGLYTIKSINTYLELNKPLNGDFRATVYKVEYPLDIVDGAIDLLDYELNGAKDRAKEGIASETISRHSISYVQRNNNNTIEGYPAELMSFTKDYIKARF